MRPSALLRGAVQALGGGPGALRLRPCELLTGVLALVNFALLFAVLVGVWLAASRALAVRDEFMSLVTRDTTELFESVLPDSALLMAHDAYALVVSSVGRLYSISADTGAISRIGWDTSTNTEFFLIWRALYMRGFFQRDSALADEYERVVVDIGAMDGLTGSNSYNFIKAGFSAFLVEPFHRHRLGIFSNLADNIDNGLQRVTVIDGVGSDADGVVELITFDNEASKTSSTILPTAEFPAWWQAQRKASPDGKGPQVTRTPIRAYTAKTLAAEYGMPRKFAVLSIDAEGVDVATLRTFVKQGFRPLYAIIELRTDEAKARHDREFMPDMGYREFAHVGSNYLWELVTE